MITMVRGGTVLEHSTPQMRGFLERRVSMQVGGKPGIDEVAPPSCVPTS